VTLPEKLSEGATAEPGLMVSDVTEPPDAELALKTFVPSQITVNV
jgi:hypothetical protein